MNTTGSNPQGSGRQAFQPDTTELESGVSKITETYTMLEQILTETLPGMAWRGGPKALYALSPLLVLDIAIQVERDKERFRYFHGNQNPSPDKVGGIIIYWIAKRRPIIFLENKTARINENESYLNEILAIYTGINRVISETRTNPTDEELADVIKLLNLGPVLQDWLYTLAYRNYSSDDMALALKLLFQSV
ncbi:MAG: hypothetical protein G8345_16160 [Magnetococcales bacterium]|nr:hypothetical protein [Magnetococcales bacterium]NGZ28409.1 hypothetical protein [Magnetococcales bacterium]